MRVAPALSRKSDANAIVILPRDDVGLLFDAFPVNFI